MDPDTSLCANCGEPISGWGQRGWTHADGYYRCRGTNTGGYALPENWTLSSSADESGYDSGYVNGYEDAKCFDARAETEAYERGFAAGSITVRTAVLSAIGATS